MKKKFFIPLVFLLSCSHNNEPEPAPSSCDSAHAAVNVLWIRVAIASIEEKKTSEMYKYQYILRTTYNNEAVFAVGSCCPTCNSIRLYYDCSGNLVDFTGESTAKWEVVGKPQESPCTFN